MRRRSDKAIDKAARLYEDLVWYERKLVFLSNIKAGREEMPPKYIWDGMLKEMKRVREKTGYDGVEDDFEWGMINGKLSALRWVLGEEWDELDT